MKIKFYICSRNICHCENEGRLWRWQRGYQQNEACQERQWRMEIDSWQIILMPSDAITYDRHLS